MKVKIESSRWTTDDENDLAKYISQGLTHWQIACAMGCKRERIKAKIKRDEYFKDHGNHKHPAPVSMKLTMGLDKKIKCPEKYMDKKMKKFQYASIPIELIRRVEGY